MSIPTFSVKNRLIVNLLSVFVLIAGTFAVFNLNREAFPNVSFDIVTVRTVYPGATPEEVEKLITRPIEDELRSVSDLDEVSSVSEEGYSLILIKIDPDAKNKPKIVNDIQQAVDRVDDFPSDLENLPITREIRTQDGPIIEVALHGPLSRKELQDLAEELETEFEELSGVSSIVRSGWQEEQIWVELDPQRLETLRVSLTEVVRAVRNRNVNVPGGTIDTGEKEFMVRTNAEFVRPDEIDEIVVRANEVGNIVRIKDVGKARIAFEDSAIITRVDGGDTAKLTILKKEKADVIDLVAEVREVIDQFKEKTPDDLEITTVNDISFYVQRRLGILLNNGWIGIILVLVSLFLFLSRPVAFWTVVGLPIAAGLGLWAMTYFGVTVNLLSMFGMIMVIGMLVDDAIIVAENVYRKLEEGIPPKRAAIEGATEVIKPVSTAILTSVVVFLPLAMMSGIMGKFVRTIPIVVILMLVASWIESIVVLPSHLTEGQGSIKKKKNHQRRAFIDRLRDAFEKLLRPVLRHHVIATFGALTVISTVIALGFKYIPLDMFPGKGIEIFFVRGEGEIGRSTEATLDSFKEVEKIIATLPAEDLDHFVTVVGLVQNDPHDRFSMRGSHVGQIIVYLTPPQNRERDAREITASLKPKLESIAGLKRIWIDEVKPGPPSGKPVAVQIRGQDFDTLQEIADLMKPRLKEMEGVEDVRDDYEAGKPEFLVQVDEDALARADISAISVARTVRTAFAGEIATVIRDGEEETDVLVRLVEEERTAKKTLEGLWIENPRGYLIPISQVAKIGEQVGVNSIKHLDNKRVVTVSANVDSDVTTSYSVNQTLEEEFSDLGKKYRGYTLSFGGEAKDTAESLDSLRRAFILAALLVFILLATTFNSLSQPILIMLAIPFAVASAFLALALHNEPKSFLAMLGIVGLSGVAVNDSIVLVDFINRKRKEGGELFEAVVSAARTRLRPVVLTSLTTVLGLTPVAYGIGGSDPFLKPMALTMAWGLALGTILTLFLIPASYLTLDKFVHRLVGNPTVKKEVPENGL